ncbi:MAG: outer membrane beta-barrel protein [Terriglobia bacterium]
MNASRRTLYGVLSLSLLCLGAPSLTAQSQGDSSSAATASDVSKKVDELQKELESLQAQIADLKKQQATASAAPAAPSPAAASTPAATAAATPVAAPATAAAPPASTLASLLGPLSITGFVDGNYGYNFEHPHDNAPSVLAGNPNTGLSGLRAFDSPYSQMSLNAVELILDKAPDGGNSRIGYHIALGAGNAMNVVGSTEPGGLGYLQYVKEAYGSYLAPVGKGLQIDFGKFVTPNGAEVIESKDNWNYSRGLLFTYAIPFYHFGLRAKYAFSDKYSLTGYLVNGWNDIVDNNTGKTFGLSFGWNPNKKWAVTETYMAGPEEPNNNSNIRQLWDNVVTYSPTSKVSFILNTDYGRGDRFFTYTNPVWWSGVAGYVRYQLNDSYALSTRYEYYDDPYGYTTWLIASNSPVGQHINEITETFERKIHGNFITRLEYRRDMTSRPTLFKGTTPVNYQDTLAAGLIYTFDLKEH